MTCSSCGADGLEADDHPMIEWDDGTENHFCDDSCTFAWMARNNSTYRNPVPQPDV